MKRIAYIFACCLMVATAWSMVACSEKDYQTFDSSRTGIYFVEDSVVYSFGASVLSVTSHVMELPVRIMGVPVKHQRAFKVELIVDKTNAEVGKQYRLPAELIIEADSVNGMLSLEIIRKELGDDKSWQVAYKLLSSDDFEPEVEIGQTVVAYFNNIVLPPNWTDWRGNKVWPIDELGEWAPIKWIKFLEYFREMENIVPVTYNSMVKDFGPDLDKVTYSWPSDYDYAVTKYILIPMYDYFVAHPEHGVSIPNPN